MQEHIVPELLRVEHISKHFAGVTALDNVSFKINPGEIIGLVGENGSGKSTMIKILAGVYTPDKGDIYVNGRHYRKLDPIRSIKENIEVIYQDFSLCPNLTVAENIAITRFIFDGKKLINWHILHKKAKESLSKLASDIPLDIEVGKLPTADRQIVAIARALVEKAHLIIMDEPTTALTQHEVQSLFNTIRELKKQGIAVLFVSHKLNEVKEISDRTIIFRDGKKVLDRKTEELNIKTMEIYMTGREIGTESLVSSKPRKEIMPLLRVEGLTLSPYFSNVTFIVNRHEVLGITGLLGSGRRELALALFGALPAESGDVYIEDKKVFIKKIQDALKYGIGYVPEDRINEGLFLPQTVSSNIVAATIDHLANKLRLINHNIHRHIAEKWIQQLNIKTPSSEIAVRSLSGGNQQRVVIAKWLASNPKILILNGPTVGVDVGSKADIHELIRNLAKQGMGIIVVSDDIPELLRVCDRILLMREGKVSEEFNQAEINEEELYKKMLDVH